MELIEGFLGSFVPNSKSNFTHGDDKTRFYENCKKMPEDWYYRIVTIEYDYNRLGFRFKDPDKVDYNNYILYTGCSHTEGIGLELEKSYPYIVSNNYNMDYVNLAVSAGGIDILEYNLMMWLHKYPLPKLIVIQYPDHSRYVSKYPDYTNLMQSGSWEDDSDIKNFISRAEYWNIFNARKHLVVLNLKNNLPVPSISINFNALSLYDSGSITLRKLDLARDLSHAGIQSHAEISNRLIQQITTLDIL